MSVHSIVILLFVSVIKSFSLSVGPWNLDSLNQAPEWDTTDVAAVSGMTSIFYRSIDYKGNPVDVFAYYSAPAGDAPEGGWPALVHVHGGGGTAYPQWVQKWNERGYACISMDLEGHVPKTNELGERLPTPHPGPVRVGVFDDWTLPIEEQWYYHAVAQIIKAHSLLRSFPEINPDLIGICGASWGGTLTSTVMGIDTRFCFAIPVYGSGYLAGSDGHQGRALPTGSEQTNFVNANYDGSAYFNRVTYPTLWFNGTNDNHFAMTCTQQSANNVRGPAYLRYTLQMPHSNLAILFYDEPFAFADQVTKGSTPLTVMKKPQVSNGVAFVNFRAGNNIEGAELFYTTDDGNWVERVWKHTPASISDTTIFAAIPPKATTIYFTATDERDLMVSSEYISNLKPDSITHLPPEASKHAPGPGDWSALRLYGHAYNVNDFSSDEYNWIKDHNWLFTIEKGHAKNIYGSMSTEYASETTASKIISNNSNARPLFYWNASDVYKSMYETINEALNAHPEWIRNDGYFNYKTDAFRDWWVSVPKNEVNNSALSGVFIDGVHTVQAKMGIDTLMLLYKMMDQIPGIVISNGFWPQGSTLLAGIETLDYVDGIHVESFFHHVLDTKEEGKMVLDALLKVPDNKYIITNSKPDGIWDNGHQFSMACFLIISNDYSFYRYYFDGYSEADLMVWHDDFGKKLGNPLGKAHADGYVYTREFQYASVRVDLTNRTSSITWYNEPQGDENLALNGLATQSSTADSGFASLAIDGNTLGQFELGSVSKTAADTMAWWQVDLEEEYCIGEIAIFGRTDTCCNTRLSDFTISVLDSNNNINFSKQYTTYPGPYFTLNASGTQGRFVKVQMNTLAAKLSLAEVRVFEHRVPVNGIRILPTSKSLLVGDSLLLDVTLSPSDAYHKNVSWSSSDTNIATVDTNGLVMAIGPGSAIITATTEDGGLSAKSNVSVYGIPVNGVEISQDIIDLFIGDTFLLTATIKPVNAYNQNVTWRSNNEFVATVDSRGLVNTLSTGTATITVKTEDGWYTDHSTVSVSPVTGVIPYHFNTYAQRSTFREGSVVEIYTSIGKLMSKKVVSGNEYNFDIDGLSNGIYIVRVIYKDRSFSSVVFKE